MNTLGPISESFHGMLPGQSRRRRPHIVLVVPRGEAVRNFLYSDTLRELHEHARVTLLSVVDDDCFLARFRPWTQDIIPLHQAQEHMLVSWFRYLVHTAHYRWLWSEVAKNLWEWRDALNAHGTAWWRWRLWKTLVRALANRPALEVLTSIERHLTWSMRPNDDFVNLFRRLKPDLVFNCSHIHGEAGELPMKVAKRMGIPIAGFIFSWDNLTSRSRIFVPYDHILVWHEGMRRHLLTLYRNIRPEQVHVTGTPQFDFHFKPEFQLTREELCQRIGIDPARPFILYTTGVDQHFPEEHRTVRLVAQLIQEINIEPKPQLVVRTYVKGTSAEMKALANAGLPDVVFPPVLWEEKWYTPMYEDLSIYSSLVRHAAMSINAASTVSLEFMMLDKPVMNLGFDPPGSLLPRHFRWIRHLLFDHFRPVAESGGVMVARSEEDIRAMLYRGLTCPEEQSAARMTFIKHTFDGTLDGKAGCRVAERLLSIAHGSRTELTSGRERATAIAI